mmetsp:Transcript_2545/g.3906  ORF Transcript_2545/g.3906 Transcript_2545/m.3906 type:complete len:340 (+) Transcript_2545:201-1220(+)|eukprot:CAMPEP_0171493750 /NCGR_PEP_ID=MMETSP0958-20121227/5135_1 /TAXON_ID=87120 /ORGANISM="Aurantiochytrium limacinum, Strain ATCCMYA-1381" /LENGTH=339 /DNA_ID=CAMNT_0012027407 /DNA_START=364 /DNA_END=1383 /DNA_ORIENTATION=-
MNESNFTRGAQLLEAYASTEMAPAIAVFAGCSALLFLGGLAGMDKRGPNEQVKRISVGISLVSIAYCFYHVVERTMRYRNTPWPDAFGLGCGIGSVMIAQLCLVFYQYVRREIIKDPSMLNPRIQIKPTPYERTFWADVKHHLSNPGAFLLMLPYLCITWMFRLMPESYYDYDKPMQWSNVLFQLLMVDLFTYTFHVLEHALPDFYKISHKPHHRFVNPHLFNAFDGSTADTVTLILFPLFTTAQLLHVSNWDYIVFGTVYSSHFMLIHSEYVNPFDYILKYFYVNVPEDHHVHHAAFNYNFGHFFTIFDRFAKTYRKGKSFRGFASAAAAGVVEQKAE